MAINYELQVKMRSIFQNVTVYKNPSQNDFFKSLSIPSYLRDWIIMKFSDETGKIDIEEVKNYISKNLPSKKDWELLKSNMIKEGERVRFLAKVRVELDVQTGEGLFYLPDLGFPTRKYEAIVKSYVLKTYKEELLSNNETWGVIECEWSPIGINGREGNGAIYITDFKPFKPYKIDLDYYTEARKEFTTEEWVDILLLAVDYNPLGFLDLKQKITFLSRLLPFVEKRINIIELAPKGTGKSYLMSQISKYGWLVSGGSISRARLFYDLNRKTPGLFSRYDYVALDEIQTISFPDIDEIRGALKGYLESGEYRVGDYRGSGDAGLVLMGNILEDKMSENINMFTELPIAFQESALIDRFHGFIKGWDLPRMREEMKAEGWALNVEYFSEIMHAIRSDIIYPQIVDEILNIPRSADTRDVNAIKRICTGFLKLFFPHIKNINDLDKEEFMILCLKPAMEMRGIIKKQLHILDKEYNDAIPEITLK
ncbi:BREX system Lon protease-like protein BrxL [Thermovenabulum sp.]|uniref:BREX system Lon protease-like protein BrxL n=1 Tax=Thermovenabulum sp. TaxID=3100335 RepID=UPI003C7E4DFE